jgi:undecaprenyl-diphosphatase
LTGAALAPEVWQAALLGVVQGLTEFLPISSTGHLILVPALFGWRGGVIDSLQFDVALHLGTLVALLAVFWRDWLTLAGAALASILRRSLADPSARLAWLILLGTVPGVVAGALLQKQVETTLRSPIVIGVTMVVIALILALLDRVGPQTRDEYSLGAAGAIAVGVGQALALIPGVSRSGSTIATGLGLGLTRASAARFSFLLSTPIIVGALAKQGLDLARDGLGGSDPSVFVIGIVAAAISGYACIRFLLAYLRTRSLMPFVIYRLVAGAGVLVLAVNGRI